MALSKELAEAGHDPQSVDARAEVTFEVADGGPAITGITLFAEADVPGLDEETFLKFAEGTKEGCPVSKALKGTNISLHATLK